MLKGVKTTVGALLPGQWLGMLDYWRFPELRDNWGQVFNGQTRRIELFRFIMREFKPVAIVETGTFGGTTTKFLSETGLPIYTIEKHPRFFGFSRMKLRHCSNVTMLNEDSRHGLKALLDGPLRSDRDNNPIFFYLDAHWDVDLPLRDELHIILDAVARPIVLIDDFQVPGDAGYQFDDYGSSGVLNESYLAPALSGRDAAILYPAVRSSEDSGARRGCSIICRRDDVQLLTASGLMREILS